MRKRFSSLEHALRPLLALPAWLLVTVGVLIPLGMLIYFGLLSGPSIDGPITGDEWGVMFSQPRVYIHLLIKSLLLGLGATAIAVLLGFPAAWAISRHVRRKGLALTLIILPTLTSNLLLIYAVFVMIAPGSVFMEMLGAVGLADPTGGILYSNSAVLIMLGYLHLPLMTVALFATVERIDRRTLDAAESLGAGTIRRARSVILPMALPGLLAGLVVVFTPAAGSFVEAAILGGTDGMMFGTLIDTQLSAVNNKPRAAAMAVALVISIFTTLVVLQYAARSAFPGALRRRAGSD